MFARHGIQNALRTRRRSVAFLLLMTLLVTLLGTSLGLSFALQETRPWWTGSPPAWPWAIPRRWSR